MTSLPDSNLYLQQPSALPELDDWIARRTQNRNRFTFSENEVVRALWQTGQEIRLREDSRFVPVKTDYALVGQPIHWRFKTERLANTQLYNLLLDEEWNGQDLWSRLDTLDHQIKNSLHVFFANDKRFKLSEPKKGYYCLELSQLELLVEPTIEQQKLLGNLISMLKTEQVWTTAELRTELRTGGLPSAVSAKMLENWLLKQPGWARVGFDLWTSQTHIPVLSSLNSRYAVLPVSGAKFGLTSLTPQPKPIEDASGTNQAAKQVETKAEIEFEREDAQYNSFSWRITLRTSHLNEGSLNVPVAARWLYPHDPKLSKIVALKGLWYEDASEMVIWLERQRHKLFGPELQTKLEVLGAGVILKVSWNPHNLVFTLVGEDEDVAQEETRLIDVDSLAETRMTQLESYRVSLRLLLADGPVSFSSIYTRLCERQQHTANKNTVRSILSASPEFSYNASSKMWSLDPQIANEPGSKALRQVALLSERSEQTIIHPQKITLPEILQTNLGRLKDFEKLF